jgi:hypothetical protein
MMYVCAYHTANKDIKHSLAPLLIYSYFKNFEIFSNKNRYLKKIIIIVIQ